MNTFSSDTLNPSSRNEKKKHRPLYEMGAGIVHAQFPHYPGSKERKIVTLPFPTFIYRGDFLRVKRDEGVRGRFWDSKNLELDFSFGGSVPSDPDDTPIRESMPKLDALLEFGPALIYHINNAISSDSWKINLHLALRSAITTDLSNLNTQGLILNPFISFSKSNIFGKKDGLFFGTLGSKLASYKWGKYYYEVAPEYSSINRPRFHAQSGLAEISISLSAFYPLVSNWWAFMGGYQAFYHKAVNKSSALLQKSATTSISLGIYWNFHQSDEFSMD